MSSFIGCHLLNILCQKLSFILGIQWFNLQVAKNTCDLLGLEGGLSLNHQITNAVFN